MEAHSFSFENKSGECEHGGYFALHLENSSAVPEVIYICLFPGVSKREPEKGEEGGHGVRHFYSAFFILLFF